MKLSLVVPCYNEVENVAAFQDAVITAFDGCGYDYEIVYVDDGSKDATLYNLKKLYQAQKCPVKVISFSRNFGKEAGIFAGMALLLCVVVRISFCDTTIHPLFANPFEVIKTVSLENFVRFLCKNVNFPVTAKFVNFAVYLSGGIGFTLALDAFGVYRLDVKVSFVLNDKVHHMIECQQSVIAFFKAVLLAFDETRSYRVSRYSILECLVQ